MTQDKADRVLNVLLAVGSMAAMFFVMKNPSSRRKALQALKVLATDTIPGYVLGEAARAWRETGQRAA
jgi:hypothetical protein